MDLTGFDGEIDVVVCDQGTESFRDAAKFELHTGGFLLYSPG
jgi:hypothetical protein